jgi:3-oxoacyl-[acyl-carrier-protein] synthase-3
LKTCIKGTGSYFPPRVVPNKYFESIVDTSDEWITTRTGIRERRFIENGVPFSDLALPAARAALDMAGLPPEAVDLIVVGTSTGDMISPASACILQKKLGSSRAVAFDVSAGCPGWVYSLQIAQKFVQDGSHKYALVIGGEVLSNRIDYRDRTTCVVFGDGAGAVVVGPCNGSGDGQILSTHLHTDGELWELLYLPGGSANPPSQEMIEARMQYVKMQGNEVFKHAVRSLETVAREALEHNGLTADAIDWFIPHQANIRIMDEVARRLEIPIEKVIITVDRYGNTSAGTIPTSLDEAVRDGRIKRGDLVLVNTFGAGFTWGASLFRF